jgi:hypothetical protein
VDSNDFITVEADVRIDDALELVDMLSPRHVVIEGLTLEDDDEDDYLVLDTADFLERAHTTNATVAEAFAEHTGPRAHTVGHHRHRLGVGAADARAPRAEPTVRVQEGIVTGVRATGAEPPMAAASGGEGTTAANGGEGGPGEPDLAALAVAVDYPKTVELQQSLSLLISLTSDVSGPDAIPVAAEIGQTIDVVVSPLDGFVVVGAADTQLLVTAEADPLPHQIKLRATKRGRGQIRVYAFHAGAPLGALTISPEVIAERASGERTTARATVAEPRPSEADLQLLIFEEKGERGEPVLKYKLTAKDPDLKLNLKAFGPVTLDMSVGTYFTDLYREIEDLPLETEPERAIATERLHALGSRLFTDLMPADLQTLLWGLQDRIDTVWVQSDEPWVPWELCRLVGTKDDRIVEGPFFCEAFKLTRWIPGVARAAGLKMSRVGLVAPPDTDLDAAKAEAAMVRGLAAGGRAVVDVPAEYVAVRNALAEGAFDAIHFTGHGSFPDNSNPAKAEIELADGQKLRPTDISGVVANLGRTTPLVFFNACEVGRQGRGLTGVGGWASALLGAGAGAFVGTHWDVTDDLAAEFAKRFYNGLLSGDSVATAALDARLSIKEGGDPTWLAYAVFADPLATVV